MKLSRERGFQKVQRKKKKGPKEQHEEITRKPDKLERLMLEFKLGGDDQAQGGGHGAVTGETVVTGIEVKEL